MYRNDTSNSFDFHNLKMFGGRGARNAYTTYDIRSNYVQEHRKQFKTVTHYYVLQKGNIKQK